MNNLQTILSIIEKSDYIDNDVSQPMLTFNLKSNYITLNNWDNTNVFFLVFSTLFSYDNSGY